MPNANEALVRSELAHLHAIIEREGTLAEMSRAYVRYVVACKAGNKVHAANQMGIDRRTIQRWFKKEPRT